jgi:beta-glucosidase
MINNVETKATLSQERTKREEVNRRTAYLAALEGIVLLENDGTLPIAPGKIALYGTGAEKTIKGGTGSGEVNERYSVNIRQGLENAGFTVTTDTWLKDYIDEFNRAEAEYGERAAKQMRSLNANVLINLMHDPFVYPFGRLVTDKDIAESGTDTCVYVVARQSGEGSDRSLEKHDYQLSEIEYKNIETVAKAYKNTIVVINSGSSMDTSFLENIAGKVNAVVFFCQQGCEGGNALADILSGKVCPSGRLTDSWAKTYEDLPFSADYSYLNGNVDEEYYKEGIYVGYRYFDSFGKTPAYPFGYGLSYTEFDVSDIKECKAEGGIVNLTAAVTNTGKVRGKEVLQAYVSPPNGKLDREYQLLAAFAKTKELAPGESETVNLTLDFSILGAYDEQNTRTMLEKGDYVIRLGVNSRAASVCAMAVLEEDVILSKHERILKPAAKIEELKADFSVKAPDGNLPRITFGASGSAGGFKTVSYVYTAPESARNEAVKQALEGLSTDELVDVVTGAGMFPGKGGFKAPGAAGSTTVKYLKNGLKNVILCDGPAGLRLQRTSAITKGGSVKMIDAQISLLNYAPKLMKKFMFGNAKKDTLVYQYCTAFPVGTALAQSWNTALMESVGDAIGVEMEEYGVTFWLAPGMNIHRNPLCGRNFEYFSEDPLLSGKVAAAITRGVQKHSGRFVTLKHFAANNQETNRNKTNANVSERTLREIYLKGFEIAVKEGRPGAVMTSYNKINGVYSPNSHDLCTKALRGEWGFDGLVMTDWFSTGKGLADAGLAIKAGNDLLMPGTGHDKKSIKAALKNGVITLDDLKRCAANVLNFIV